jgi:hypothetical protein
MVGTDDGELHKVMLVQNKERKVQRGQGIHDELLRELVEPSQRA